MVGSKAASVFCRRQTNKKKKKIYNNYELREKFLPHLLYIIYISRLIFLLHFLKYIYIFLATFSVCVKIHWHFRSEKYFENSTRTKTFPNDCISQSLCITSEYKMREANKIIYCTSIYSTERFIKHA